MAGFHVMPIGERIAEFQAVMPSGFRAPARFLVLLREPALVDIYPWRWLYPYRGHEGSWSKTIRAQYPSRALVPFAKHDLNDDVFCFDGTDTTGNPRVYIVHTFASPGWEDRGYWDDFDVFMEAAEEEHAEWLREEAKDE
ncbi:SMI1/KNR4 family protein [Microbacterium protaetiae]|uniref:SMI1/KNR4 family protein n=1 Tax=Microbacterium protaetiae TaxID=2509458 RepID=A0A4P6EI28_9MICO|nr:SMI1/KNR4 family protein [Microbacterium protaetiae]QAY59807.1 SMI1/KNR4 family protein [Microbacterium protaetiae]